MVVANNGLRLVLSPRLAVWEVFATSRKQRPFTVLVADLTGEAGSCLFLRSQHTVRCWASMALKTGQCPIRRAGWLDTRPLAAAASLKPPGAEGGVRTYQ